MNPTLFDRMTDDQLISCAERQLEKFNRAWVLVMRTHYKSGAHIDASAAMDRAYKALGELQRYIYSNRPAAVHDRFCAAANWQERC
jgi:hypothetical protein